MTTRNYQVLSNPGIMNGTTVLLAAGRVVAAGPIGFNIGGLQFDVMMLSVSDWQAAKEDAAKREAKSEIIMPDVKTGSIN